MFAFAPTRARRKPVLTPLIDVVFLLLVFFMLAAQFGRETAVDMAHGSGAGEYSGPPRLITLLSDGVLLNGISQTEADLPQALVSLTDTPDDAVLVRARDGADVQRLTEFVQRLTAVGFTRLILVE
ncbi:biopolymer transport protein ExbD [Roseovarius lutimaris]|uniref:Biopolymer transport protein ExbD n=1 Tax=Roseovarius lutimaris TaxID=1005928 RepID=A0A1I5H3E9_9RHOB|nr:biopolymer transporter ExbD [Roseovarius lutimaris]SFO42351.1 biopolymer transport protein ExbD [Roseovarius lutimaris]